MSVSKKISAALAAILLLGTVAVNVFADSSSSRSAAASSSVAAAQTTYSGSSLNSRVPSPAVTTTYSAADSSSINLDSVISDYINNSSQSDSSSESDESSSEVDKGYRIERPEPDTAGNASIVKSEKIIFNTETMQFIAVTTKDGHVFYVLINYSAEEDEDNVYFLNKVDDYDLYALLHAEDENSSQFPEEAMPEMNEDNNAEKQAKLFESNMTSEISSTEEQVNGKGAMNQSVITLAIIVLAGGGAAAYVLYKKKKSSTSADVSNIDYDFDDDVEINEDEE